MMDKAFNSHERVVLASAIKTIHVFYGLPDPFSVPGDEVTAKAFVTVFKFRFPELPKKPGAVHEVFSDVMTRLKPEERLDLAVWYLEKNEVAVPVKGCRFDDIRTFATNISVLSKIFCKPVPRFHAHTEEDLRQELEKYWIIIRQAHFL